MVFTENMQLRALSNRVANFLLFGTVDSSFIQFLVNTSNAQSHAFSIQQLKRHLQFLSLLLVVTSTRLD